MIDVEELSRWLGTLTPGSSVAVDDGGLNLVEIVDGKQTEAYLEVGGIPQPPRKPEHEDHWP